MSGLRKILPVAARSARPMSRNKADTLLLLLACGMVITPHALHLPPWVSIVSLLLMLWRGWITFRGNRMPPRQLLLPIVIFIMGGVFLSFHTLLGRDAGIAMLTLLLTCKLLEMHAARDLFVVVFLSFFLLLTNFFYSQTIASAAWMIAAVIAILTAQLSFQYTGAVPPLKQRLQFGALIFALAVPLTIALFFLFPRIQGPLWGTTSNVNVGHSGLSDSMAPGNIAKLALSDDIAFRVKFTDAVPPNAQLYWRGIVLDQFDGRTWRKQPAHAGQNKSITLNARGAPVRYQITQEASDQPWLFALELPQAIPQLADNPTGITPDMQLVAAHPLTARVRYDVSSYLEHDLQPDGDGSSMQDWLALPAGFNPAARNLAAKMEQQSGDGQAKINAVLHFFREGKFSYTLQPPPLGRDGIDDFLFSTRAGFCEHYASAFVFLMRAMHMPARVVTGYQGGQMNPVDGFMTVRQSDAHAWAEVWIAKRGWLRVDPTAAVAPNRIEKDVTAAVPAAPALDGLLNVNDGSDSWLTKARFTWDAVNNGWNQWVLNYTPDKQKSLLRSLGFGNIDWQTMTLLTFAVVSIVMLIIAFPLVRHRRKMDPLEAAYATLCRQMARQGYPHQPYEGPRSYAARLLGSASSLAQERKRTVRDFLLLYETARYAPLDRKSLARIISKLKSLLNQSR